MPSCVSTCKETGPEQSVVDRETWVNIMSSDISNILPSVLKARPALQDGQWSISRGYVVF